MLKGDTRNPQDLPRDPLNHEGTLKCRQKFGPALGTPSIKCADFVSYSASTAEEIIV